MEDDHDQLHALTVFSTAVSMLCHNIGARGLGEEGGGEPGVEEERMRGSLL